MPSVPHPGAGVPEGEKEDNSAFGALPYGGHSCVLAMGGGEPKKGNVGSSASPSLLPRSPDPNPKQPGFAHATFFQLPGDGLRSGALTDIRCLSNYAGRSPYAWDVSPTPKDSGISDKRYFQKGKALKTRRLVENVSYTALPFSAKTKPL